MASVTIMDVARKAGVSKKTVSRVINNEANVRPQTKEKVQTAIEELGFKRNPLGMALAKNRSLFIALLADNPSPGYLMNLQKGILQACTEEHMGLFLYDCQYRSPSLVEEIQTFVENTLADGLILVPPLSDKIELLDMLDSKGVSYVRIGPKDTKRGDFVGSNTAKAAFDMTEYLIKLKHRHIGFILGHPDQASSKRTEKGFRDAHAKAGIPVDESLIAQGYYTHQSGVDAAMTLLNKTPRPTVIFASNDEMAVGALCEAQSRGIKVPEELSIAGIDDISITTKVWPNITTMRQPLNSIGYTAASILIRRLQKKPIGPSEEAFVNQLYDCELVIRQSTKTFVG
ncbi:LacI family DNA-binding transcriptional regulator [Alteromonas gracilis]|jgi:LacI family transcriptional regulator|uniref:LacI family transcriptional regulator n=1 Tax=Alteromonas gracilis TaxID=1479524 RepID=A0ABX5CM32_9ALTE|nr:LacI family DNA-binding transcriptional regulator [Alteromonas gracilis]PRO67496.1 LacI family transcriptional regulator [Alteromonas gracilis]